MIEHHQGYTAIKRHGRNSFRPIGKYPFKMIHNARAVKYDLIQQFEASTGIAINNAVNGYTLAELDWIDQLFKEE